MTQPTIRRWRQWATWDPTTAAYPPRDVQPGVLVDADLVVRADHIGVPFSGGEPRPVATRHVFTVSTGEAWVLYPSWTNIETTHVVTCYRVWGGTAEEYLNYEEESLTEWLHPDAQRQHEIDNGWVEP